MLSQPAIRDSQWAYRFAVEVVGEDNNIDYCLVRTACPGETQLQQRYADDTKRDFALLVKFTFETPFEQGQRTLTVFICAGIDRAGSKATLDYLITHWEKLARDNGNDDFFYLFPVFKTSGMLAKRLLHGRREKGIGEFRFED